jgi:lysophospholipase L1-like esterase
MLLHDNATVLFHGDSITDAGRNQENEFLGTGYAMMASAWFSAAHPKKNVRFINCAVGGNRVKDLRNCWRKDCLELKPDVVSILIGVNDIFRKGWFGWRQATSIESFENDYRVVLESTRNALSSPIILLEPFLLPVTEAHMELRKNLDPIIEVVNSLSREFKTLYIDLDKIFSEASKVKEPSFWAQDGVHPTLAGHALIAQHWLKVVNDSSKHNCDKN